MPSKLLGAFLSLGIFYQRLVSASAYYNNEFFTRITRDEVNSLWTNEVDAHSFLADPYTCEIVLSTNRGGTRIYKDFLNTETVRNPPTIVIIPRDKANQSFLVDVKYADFTAALDIPVDYTDAECYIVPPYKPLMYVGLRSREDSFVDIYALRQNDPEDTNNIPPKDNCNNSLNPDTLQKCKVVGPPISYDYPTHPFFLTASRNVAKCEITLFTIVSIERLQRLVDLAENWNWPISAAISVSNPAKDIPLIMKSWLRSSKMRRNVDIHLLYDDKFPIVADSSKLFPINYLRDLALKNTRSKLVMFVEGDYVVNKEFKRKLASRIPLFLNDTRSLYVTPAFDAVKGVKLAQIPENKEKLIKELNKPDRKKKFKGKVQETYKLQNISHWANQNEIYDIVMSRGDFFEPYFVTHRNTILYDETFNSYGGDKTSQVKSMLDVGLKLKMLPDTFMVHLAHNSIKGYVPWLKVGYEKTLRYWLKTRVFAETSANLKGLITNGYFPPWLIDNTTNYQLPSCTLKYKAITKRVEHEKSKVKFLKNNLVILLSSLGIIILLVVLMSRREND